jgi:hypothetical protein
VLLFNIHHIVSDGWSIGIIIRELSLFYAAFLRSEPSPLPAPTLQFADYSHWEREAMSDEALKGHLAYWRRQLAGVRSDLTLPGQRPRPATPRFQGEIKRLAVPLPLSEKLRELSQHEEVTLFVTMLSAFNVLLHLYTGQEDIVVGTNFANRNEPELEHLVGFFVNNLALRTDLSGDPTFRELVQRVRDTTLSAYTHQAVPFEQVIADLQPHRYGGYAPLFRVMFTFENFPMPPLDLKELSLQALRIESKRANFDLNMMMVDSDRGLVGSFVYDTDLFDGATIARLLVDFEALLERIVEEPGRELSRLSPGEGGGEVSAFTGEL